MILNFVIGAVLIKFLVGLYDLVRKVKDPVGVAAGMIAIPLYVYGAYLIGSFFN